jgi:prepilin-type N-terminal cleavage/methylation domain-containing protein
MAKNSRAGYTIVELMIVLAVTSVTAVSALLVIRGQQQKGEFTQAVRNFETKLTDVANDVSNGFFPDTSNNRTCSSDNSGIHFTSVIPGSVQQGTNSDCVFAGKAVQFSPGGDPEAMRILSVTTRRRTRDNREIFALNSLQNNDIGPVPGLDESGKLVYGLRVDSVRYDNTGRNWPAVVFLSGFGTKEAASGSLTGSPKIDLYALSNTGSCASSFDAALAIISCYVDPLAASSSGVVICASQGGAGKSARYSLGKNGRELTVTTEILAEGATC